MGKHRELLRKHIDRYCGDTPFEYFREETTGVGVARFNDIPDIGLVTYVSIGVSGHVLAQESGKAIRQELVMTVDRRFGDLPCQLVIFSVAKLMLSKHLAVREGELLGPWGSLFPEDLGLRLTGVICTYPAWFDDGFCSIKGEETTVFVELIPVTDEEAVGVRTKGWSSFLADIDEGRVQILDLSR